MNDDWKFMFVDSWHGLAASVLQNAKAHEFDSLQHECIGLALMHSEISEALEGYRDGNPPSEKLDGFSQVEEELADLVIRIMDHCAAREFRVAEAVVAKMKYNRKRPVRHGNRKY